MVHLVRVSLLALAGILIVSAPPAAGQPPEPLAIVSAIKGKVEVVAAHSKQSQRASFGQPLQRGDRISVGNGGAATIFFNDGNVVELGGQSSITIGTRVDKPASAEIASEVFTQVSSFVTAGSRQSGLVAASSMRGDDGG